ncbi:MAG: zinc-ribbon domain-containing protein [Promethearchaeota archaeon]
MVKSISENELNSLWRDFGKNMNLVAIMTVLTLVTGITGIIALIFLFKALGNIKMINYRLKSQYLDDFRKKYITSFILKLVLIPFIVAGLVLLFLPIPYIYPEMEYFPFYWINILIGVIPMVIAFILFIVSYSIEMKAWENLKLFLEQNRSMFPEYISREAIDGVENLRTGALLYALGFLVITAIIGFILQVIGFFKLAKFEKIYEPMYQTKTNIPQAPVFPIAPISQSQPSPNVLENRVVGASYRFCPNCGTELKDEGKSCPDCGSSIS